MVSRWCLGVVVSRWCPGVPVVGVPVAVVLQNVQWCLGSVPVVGVPVAVVLVLLCVSVVSRSYPRARRYAGSVPVVFHPIVVLVVCRGCPGGVPPSGVPVVSRSCPVFHAVVTTISENL